MRRSTDIIARSTTALVCLGLLALVLTGCGTLSSTVRGDSALLANQPAADAQWVDTPLVQPVANTDPAAVAQVQPKPAEEDASAQQATTEKLPDIPEVEEYDPWESFNEVMFEFNRKLDKYLLKPAAQAYNVIMPQPFQVLIANGFDNIQFLPRLVNSLLQAKWGGAGRELARFLINSTAGIGGLFDPAKDYWGIEKSNEDFGQTLGVWGVGPGPYLVLPFLPPLTVRDGIGKAVDGAMDPLSYFIPFIWDRLGMKIGETVNERALNIDLFQGFEESVIDMYSAVRHAYLQRRERLVRE